MSESVGPEPLFSLDIVRMQTDYKALPPRKWPQL
jgi:hypothetical protein